VQSYYNTGSVEVSIIELDGLGRETLSAGFEEVAYQFVPAGVIQSPPSYH